MPRPIQFRFRYAAPADRVYGALVDRAYLETRLARIGGKDAALVELSSDGQGARYLLHQGVSGEQLPGPVRRILSGDLVIERAESWQRAAPNRYEGTVSATVRGAPGKITGALSLAGLADEGSCEYGLDGTAEVGVPLIGRSIENMVVEQITKLVDGEARFTEEWLAGSG